MRESHIYYGQNPMAEKVMGPRVEAAVVILLKCLLNIYVCAHRPGPMFNLGQRSFFLPQAVVNEERQK